MASLVFLWCVPRSRSTDFEKMMAEGSEFRVIGEPFIDIYKLGIRSPKDHQIAQQQFDSTFQNLQQTSNQQPVFVKDMAYHANEFLSDEQIASTRHAFLIRHPSLSIPSLYKMRENFSPDQCGFAGQVALYKRVSEITGKAPFIMDAEQLAAKPEQTVRSYFSAMQYLMPEGILNWQAGSRDDWQGRESWHLDAINSRGFIAPNPTAKANELPERVKRIIADNLPHYEYLQALAERFNNPI